MAGQYKNVVAHDSVSVRAQRIRQKKLHWKTKWHLREVMIDKSELVKQIEEGRIF